MRFADIIGNEPIKSQLMRAVREDRIRQGLILAGQRGLGKFRFALALAAALNCQNPVSGDSCGKCPDCFKSATDEHPDVQVFVKDGTFIKIDSMREMSSEAQFRPYVGKRRVFILDEADRLNIQAANSILKTLEEPPETSLIILVTSRPQALLETIRSRCQTLHFMPLSSTQIESYLRAHGKRPEAETVLLARLAQGSIGRALEIDLGESLEKRKILLQLIDTALVAGDRVRLINAAEYLGKKLERDQFIESLETLSEILADIFHLKMRRPPESIVNIDLTDRIGKIADQVALERVTAWAGAIDQFMQALPRNLNRQIAMESMLISV